MHPRAYMLTVHWCLSNFQPIRDDDGQGVKGALEWARCMESAAGRIEK